MHHCPKARMAWWKDGWQDELVVAMVCRVGKSGRWGKAELVQDKVKDTVWQCDPEACKFGSDQGMAWEEDVWPVMNGVL